MIQRLIYLFLLVFISGCAWDEETKVFDDQKAFLVGQITNSTNEKVVLTFGEKTLVQTLEKQGKFRFDLDLDNSVYALFNHGDNLSNLFLRPGDSLYIQLDVASGENQIVYSGTRAIENQFLKEKNSLKAASQLNSVAVFNKSPKAFSQIVNKHQSNVDQLLNKYIETEVDMDPLFKKQQGFLTKYEMGSLLLDYPLFKGEDFNESKLPTDYYNFLSEIELNNATIQNTTEYNTFIRSYISRNSKQAAYKKALTREEEPLSWTQTNVDVVEKEITLPKIRANLITESIEWHLHNYGCENIDSLMSIFKNTNPDPEIATRINKFANRCQALRDGKAAPTFSGVDENGTVFMSNNLIGKYVYVDVWATWCGPCKKETPYFEELIQQYADNDDFAFVSISYDKKKDAWERYLKTKNLKGIQLISPKGFESKMANEYGITNIPRYILIDKKGNLINADAPLPSSIEIKSILTKLAE